VLPTAASPSLAGCFAAILPSFLSVRGCTSPQAGVRGSNPLWHVNDFNHLVQYGRYLDRVTKAVRWTGIAQATFRTRLNFCVWPCVRKRTATVLHPDGPSRTVGSCQPRTTVSRPLPSPTAWLSATPSHAASRSSTRASGERIWSRWLGDPLLAQPALSDGRLFSAWPHAGQHRCVRPARWASALGGRPCARCHHHARRLRQRRIRQFVRRRCLRLRCVERAAAGVARWTPLLWVVGDAVHVAQRSVGVGDHAEPGGFAARNPMESAPFERTADLDVRSGTMRKATRAKLPRYHQASWAAAAKAESYSLDGAVGFSAAPAAAKIETVSALLGEARAWRHQGLRPVVVDGVLFETTGDALDARTLRTGRYQVDVARGPSAGRQSRLDAAGCRKRPGFARH
jgi:hypothetical protein